MSKKCCMNNYPINPGYPGYPMSPYGQHGSCGGGGLWLILLILVVLQFRRPCCGEGWGSADAKEHEHHECHNGCLIDNSILFLVVIYFICCCNKSRLDLCNCGY